MIAEISRPRYSLGEEIANSVTHGVGAVLSIAGLAVLVTFACLYGNAWHIVACSVFGATLVLSYTASTLYHSIQLPGAKRVLRILDHSAIYLLIAGTYTPFMLVNLNGPWGWSLLGAIWGLAILGIAFQSTVLCRWASVSLALYVAMGWAVVIAIKPLLASVATGGLVLLILGGMAYTAGVGFYVWRRLPYNHMIWHVFVLAGSVLHFFAVLFYVIPIAGGA
ncbi:MAG: hemolysin III family protein [Desulfobacterales bacterium]|nr:hemolysin III family protein [Desulfobacterales bacterium]MDD4072567.1 hemolysin III family protein [Desulfobacterales bacterium]MDD4393173.1 hemolysin III family protein [Desulfobacterales bacterium]